MAAILPAPDDAERLFFENAGLLEQVTGSVARQHGLSADKAARFSRAIHLMIAANDYKLLRRFRGCSTQRTYLLVIAEQHLRDARARRSSAGLAASLAPPTPPRGARRV